MLPAAVLFIKAQFRSLEICESRILTSHVHLLVWQKVRRFSKTRLVCHVLILRTPHLPMADVTEPFQELNLGIANTDGDQLTDGITDREFIDFRRKCGRFRVLIVGPRNSGKTTILERFGDKIERAEFKSPDGKKVRGFVIICRKRSSRTAHRSMDNLGELWM